MPTLEQQKKLYEEGNHICLMKHGQSGVFNRCSERQMFQPQWTYQLIHKNHSHILDAFLDGCEILCNDGVPMADATDTFIEKYDESFPYYAIPKSLENCYCEASDYHYSALHSTGLSPEAEAEYPNCKVYVISYDSFVYLYNDDKIPTEHKKNRV